MSHLGFALEYSLGHTTHAQNLKRVLADDTEVRPSYVELDYHDTRGTWTRLPGVRSNWSVRASLGAYLGLRPQAGRLDGALFHTQVTSLFSTGLMRRIPSVVSLDATPRQFDALGALYGHSPSGSARLEAVKKRMNQRAFKAARRLVTWSQWAKDSLIADYGVPDAKIAVIPPGVDTAQWTFPRGPKPAGAPVQILFVGADFARKGGETLLEAFSGLPAKVNAHLHIVTRTAGVRDGLPNVTVHRDVAPNSERLRCLFADADLFAFPTRGDCLGIAALEAMASGLPIIATQVGALGEVVTHGRTGLVVPPDDAAALGDALALLVGDGALRLRLGVEARQDALARFDAQTNYRRLIDTVKSVSR